MRSGAPRRNSKGARRGRGRGGSAAGARHNGEGSPLPTRGSLELLQQGAGSIHAGDGLIDQQLGRRENLVFFEFMKPRLLIGGLLGRAVRNQVRGGRGPPLERGCPRRPFPRAARRG